MCSDIQLYWFQVKSQSSCVIMSKLFLHGELCFKARQIFTLIVMTFNKITWHYAWWNCRFWFTPGAHIQTVKLNLDHAVHLSHFIPKRYIAQFIRKVQLTHFKRWNQSMGSSPISPLLTGVLQQGQWPIYLTSQPSAALRLNDQSQCSTFWALNLSRNASKWTVSNTISMRVCWSQHRIGTLN